MNISSVKYQPLRHVMNYIPVSLRREQDDTDQWKSWALEYLSTVDLHQHYVYDIDFIDINNHKGYLPEGLHQMTSIQVLTKNPSESELASLTNCITYDSYKDALADDDDTDCPSCNETTTTTTTTETILPGGATESTTVEKSLSSSQDTCCSINYRLFLNSDYYKNCFQPMRYIGRTGEDYFTKSALNKTKRGLAQGHYTEFSITEGGCLLTEFESGTVVVEYRRPAKDGDEFIAPAHPQQLWRGMAHFGIAQHWLDRDGYHESGAMARYEKHLAIARNYMREARGILRMKSISMKNQHGITYLESAILKIPSVWSFKTGGSAGLIHYKSSLYNH